MPINKAQQTRYRVLDSCFSNFGRKYFIEDLINECNKKLTEVFGNISKVTKRTVQYDIEFMESSEGWDIPLQRLNDGKRIYYRYEDECFSIESLSLSRVGWNQLQLLFDMLHQIDGVPQLLDVYKIEGISQGKIKNRKQITFIQFDNNPYLKGIDFFGNLMQGILNKSVLKIQYQPFFMDNLLDFYFHPYLLKQYNQRWFCFGLNEENQIGTWNIALDRIVSIQSSSKVYVNTNVNWNEYFDDVVGVTVIENAPVEQINVYILDSIKNYIESKPIHGSQKIRKWERGYFIELNLKVNRELINLLRSMANEIFNIEPNWLRDEVFLQRSKIDSSPKNHVLFQ